VNNQLRYLPAINYLMPLVRLVGGGTILLAGFDRWRQAATRKFGLLTGLGALCILISLVDFALFAVLAFAPEHRRPDVGLREEYVLEEIGAGDFILVGDSFVWGQGVDLGERFGNRLEEICTEAGRPSKVYSLGLTGIGVPQYIDLLSEVPRGSSAERVVVAFYMNDMPPVENLRKRVWGASVSLGRGCPTLRLFGDKLSSFLAGDVHDYHRYIVDSYNEDHPSYASRVALLEDQLRSIHELATERSTARPVLLILPIMVDFNAHPLEHGHELLAGVAERLEYDLIDLLPVFRAELGDADGHRTSSEDNHFDALTHDLVARTLYEQLVEQENPIGQGQGP